MQSKNDKITEVKSAIKRHVSEIGSCLDAKNYYSFDRKLTAGTKLILMNDISNMKNSMGKIVADNPNFQFVKTVGLCSLVEVFADNASKYEITIETK